MSHGPILGGLAGRGAFIWMPNLLPRIQEHPWTLRAPEDEEALLAAEELLWDKKMSTLRQTQGKGQTAGEPVVEPTEDEQEMEEEESVSDDFLEPSTRNESTQAEWETSGAGSEY